MYNYETEKPIVFTEDGQRMFLDIRDNIYRLLRLGGAVRMTEAVWGVPGDTFLHMACVDRLVELGEIREITKDAKAQYRVFVETK